MKNVFHFCGTVKKSNPKAISDRWKWVDMNVFVDLQLSHAYRTPTHSASRISTVLPGN